MTRQSEKSLGGLLQAGGLALLITGLLALAALGANGDRLGRHGRLAGRPVPAGVQDSWVTLMTIVYVVVVVGVLVLMFRRRHLWVDPGSHWLRSFCAVLLLMALVTGIGYWAMTHASLRERAQKLQARQGQQGEADKLKSRLAARPFAARHAHFQWPLALGLGTLVLLGGVWVVVRRNFRPEPTTRASDSVEEELAQAIGTTIDDLRSERNARRAVIASYATMERVLGSHGLERQSAEVPYEYLARVLQRLRVREDAIRSLTQLFEYAKFSPHEIDASMKERAIDSLLRIQEDIQMPRELAA